MARTISTAARPASSPSSEGNSSADDDDSCEKQNCVSNIGVHANSSVAAATETAPSVTAVPAARATGRDADQDERASMVVTAAVRMIPLPERDLGPAGAKYSARRPQRQEHSHTSPSHRNDHDGQQHARNGKNNSEAAGGADYARASTTFARMPCSPERDHGPVGRYDDARKPQRRENSYTLYRHGGYQQSHYERNEYRGNINNQHRLGRSDHHSSLSRPSLSHHDYWEQDDRSWHDKPFARRDERGHPEYEYRHCHDGSSWGREQGGDRDYNRRQRQNQPDDRPANDRFEGHYSESYESRDRDYSPHKRHKSDYNQSYNSYTNCNNWNRRGPRGRHRYDPSTQRQEQKALSREVAELRKEIKDLQKAKDKSIPHTPLSRNVDDGSSTGMEGARQDAADHIPVNTTQHDAASVKTRATNNLTTGLSACAVHHGQTESIRSCNPNSANRNHGTGAPVHTPVNTLQHDVASSETVAPNELTTGSSTSAVHHDQTESIRNVNVANSASQNVGAQASKDHKESCYDASTDEEIYASQSDTFSNNHYGHVNVKEEDADSNGEDNQSVADCNTSIDSDEDSIDPVLRDNYNSPHFTMAFCCQNCRCCEDNFLKLYDVRNNCGNSGDTPNSGNTWIYHKGCCHGDRKGNNANYLSPMIRATNETFGKKKKKASRLDTSEQLQKSYNTAKREETQYENEEGEEAKDNSIYGNSVYMQCSRNFQKRKKTHRRPFRVLDLFSGIGSGAVVLKRLKIPIDTMVHVEHDPVAVEVCKFNHRDDAITHNYIDTFEEVYGTNDDPDNEIVEAALDKYGPFDIVLSGAPCQNYSGLNAFKNDTCKNAQYLLKVGRLIQKLDEIQMCSRNVGHNVLFLSENVVFKEHDHVDQCYSNEGSLPPIRLDAKDFGPCKRNRFYWTNIPVSSTEIISKVASGVSVDHGFLDEGYGAVARVLQDDAESMTMPVKSNAFLASLSRIDDNRMIKHKIDDNVPHSRSIRKYQIETYSTGEREKMMGLPSGYVKKPLKNLFSNLTQKAFVLPETSKDGKTYRDFLPRTFWHFRKRCNFKFRPNSEYPFFQLALSSPLEGKSQLSFYEEEQYCKHLIGNGWSIPVVEHLLGSLKELFADDVVMLDYDLHTNPHPWEPYISL